MSKFDELKPEYKEKVYDLLKRAGIRVKENRFFLSQCAFRQDNKIVVLNFWYKNQIKPRGKNIIIKLNFPTASNPGSYRDRTVRDAIKLAYEKNIKIRIIILDGKMANKHSKVSKRALDPISWSVKTYNEKAGRCLLVRDIHANEVSTLKQKNAIDDLSDAPEGNDVPDRAIKNITRVVIKRDNRVRAHVIKRAGGRCQYCNKIGFQMENGKNYLEAHHIIALSDSGKDTVDNVIALCPLHHRQAHFGANAVKIEAEFIRILKKLSRM